MRKQVMKLTLLATFVMSGCVAEIGEGESEDEFDELALGLTGTCQGSVVGSDFVDYCNFSRNDTEEVKVTVTGTGNGSNELDVKLQEQRANGNWITLSHFELTMPNQTGNTGWVAVLDTTPLTSEDLRVRLGRKVGTQAIDWDATIESR